MGVSRSRRLCPRKGFVDRFHCSFLDRVLDGRVGMGRNFESKLELEVLEAGRRAVLGLGAWKKNNELSSLVALLP